MYVEAEKYYREHGDLRVRKRHITAAGLPLGAWLATQRRVRAGKAAGRLTEGQAGRLSAIGMRWQGAADGAWERNYAAAERYYREHGDLLAGTGGGSRDGAASLGRWLAGLRAARKGGMPSAFLTPGRVAALDAIGMVWDVPCHRWERGCAAAERYYREHGDLAVPHGYVDADGFRLGAWVGRMRAAGRHGAALTEGQARRLSAIGMGWGSRHDAAWEAAYREACRYREEHGGLDVPAAYAAGGIALGKWVRHQRDARRAGKLPAWREERLSMLGMGWEAGRRGRQG